MWSHNKHIPNTTTGQGGEGGEGRGRGKRGKGVEGGGGKIQFNLFINLMDIGTKLFNILTFLAENALRRRPDGSFW